MVHALWHGLPIHEWRGEKDTASGWSDAVMALASEQGLAQQLAEGTFRRGPRLLTQGQAEAGRALVHQGLAAYRATGAEVRRPYYLALLAETYGHVGQTQDGLAALADAMSATDETGDRWWEAELYRLKGELQLAPSVDQHVAAETCFHQALDIARRQQAKSLELRAAMSLSRLWQQQGKRVEARELLVPIYGWFTEGFDTADLQEAKALLEELS